MAQGTPIQTMGLWVLLPYLFLIFSRVLDIKWSSLHLPAIMLALLIILLPASTRLLAVLGDRNIGRYFTLFTLWVAAGVPFSAWRGGAFFALRDIWLKSFLVFLAIGCLTVSVKHLRRISYTLAFAVIALGLIARVYGELQLGRLALPQGKFSNPNDLAQALLIGFPFLLFILMESGLFMRFIVLLSLAPLLQDLIRTGSRSGMLGLAAVLLFLFFRCSPIGRLLVITGAIAALAAAVFLLPHDVLARYTTFLSADDTAQVQDYDPNYDVDMQERAAGSAQNRLKLLKESLMLTVHHPIFGVGIAQTEAAKWEASGHTRIDWHETHNAYTELSAETGLIGFFVYLAACIGCIRLCSRLSRFAEAKVHPQWLTISRLAFCIQVAMISFAVTGFFSSVAYEQFLPTLAGMVLALASAVQPEFGEWQRQKQSAPQVRLRQEAGLALPARLPAGRAASA